MLKYKTDKLSAVDTYLGNCEQRFSVEYLKRNTLPAEQAWKEITASTNARYFPRGRNTALECLQFGGNREFWDGFASEQDIARYFSECYRYVIDKIGFLHTHENILCAATVTEQVRRNLFVWYLPITETWTSKVMSEEKNERGYQLQLRDEYGEPVYCHRCEIDEPRLSSSAFWKARGGLTSFSDLQEDFFNKISCKYGAVRGESKSLLKNTNAEQAKRFDRSEDDLYNELPPFDDCLIRKLVIPPTDGNYGAHKAQNNIFCEQPKISVPGLDFFARGRYYRITFPYREANIQYN